MHKYHVPRGSFYDGAPNCLFAIGSFAFVCRQIFNFFPLFVVLTKNMKSLVHVVLLFLPAFFQVNCIREWGDVENDFVVVGAGTAGSALASRLTEDVKFRVLLLEAGGEPQVHNDIPYFAPGPLMGDMDWKYWSEPQEHACKAFYENRSLWSRGKGLGGSTLINAMVYQRGDPKDYDNWEKLGNEGWSYKDVLPVFKKIEDYRGPIDEDNEEYHNSGGPVTVSRPSFHPDLTQTFLDAGRELGYSEVDYNGRSQRGFSHVVFTVRNGTRCSTYRAYLKDVRSRENLQIVTHALVTKVEFDENKRAVGLIFEKHGHLWRAKAKKEIILSGGSVNTPQILMLSGIGPKSTLDKYKIPVVNDLPGVGQNLQDHCALINPIVTFKGEVGFRLSRDVTAENFELLETKGQGPLTVPFRALGIAFVDSEYSNSSANWPDIEFLFNQMPLNFPVTKDYALPILQLDGKSQFAVYVILLRPKSSGYVTIQSSDPHDPPLMNPNYASEQDDVNRLVSGWKIFQKLIKTEAFQKFEAYWDHDTPTKGCEKYEFKSDEYLECNVRHYSTGSFHPSSSCKMGPKNDKGAVVDSKLRVYGVRNLRIADLSIAPNVISGHTMGPSIMIGERAAEFIKHEWKGKVNDKL